MAKTIQVNLQFNANVENAKKQMQSLQNQLNSVINNASGNGKLGMTTQIQEATRSAMDLKIALNNATNVDTGKLNLNKFQSELNRSGKSIQQYAQQLRTLGPEGVKAFNQMASAVASANTKLFNLSGELKKFSDTMFNTLRWSVASSAIQGVTSAISGTISYARELDTSLNNIRIVTGKSNEEMAKFAETANKMAKTLSSTTKKYSDASLIYFQQGLADKEVKERTDVTVKLANVTRESAEQVSEWMTAIWNNFDDGSEKLEYYADVLAELGAATASSADEIAGGLEKFAAVADTIGLSYEYAASMLATITAETRQSEDVVGTALKTILSRMEQLNQGKTLDDGTTLGKYSQALLNIGVNIKDVNGELKDMDLILQQTGNKWDTLARDQQIALAQAVAGIRQYTQFMALMDNWDVMEKNLAMTKNANGALQKQQEIYEDSVEAAEARMTASMEKVKSTLLDGDDMKGMYDLAGGFLDLVAEMLEAFGGLRTILLGVATALTKMYQPQIASFMSQMVISAKDLWSTMRHPIQAMKGENASQGQRFKQDVVKIAGEQTMRLGNTPGEASMRQEEAKIQEALLRNEKNMSEGAKQRAQWELQILETKRDQLLAISEAVEKEKEQNLINRDKIIKGYSDQNDASEADNYLNKREALGTAKGAGDIAQGILDTNQNVDMSKMSSEELEKLKSSLKSQVKTIQNEMKKIDFKDTNGSIEKVKKGIDELGSDSTKDIRSLLAEVKKLNKELQNTNIDNPFDDVKLKNTGDDIENTARQQQGLNAGVEEFIGLQEGLNNKINNGGFKHWSDSVAAGISNLTTYSTGISMLAGSFETLFSDIAEGNVSFTGMLSTISSMTMSLGMLIPVIFSFIGAINAKTAAQTNAKMVSMGLLAADNALTAGETINAAKAQLNALKEATAKGIIDKANVQNVMTELAALIAKQRWATAGAVALAVTPLLLSVGASAISGIGSAPTEEEQAIADEEAAKGRLDEAKQSYDNVKSSLSEYKDSQKAIDELTVGTQEWVEALQSANQQVIELLSQYPELNQFVTTAENGRMTVSDEGWTHLANQKQKQVSLASVLAQGVSVRRQRVSAEADRLDLASEFGDIGKYGEQVIGYDINGNAKRIEFEGNDEDYIQDKISDLAKEYLEKGEEVFLGQTYKDLEQELSILGETSEEVTDKIRQLVRQEQQLAAAEENLLQQRVNSILTDGLGYNSHILTQGVQKHVKDYVKNDAKYQKFDQVDLDNLDWGAGEASTIKEFQAGQADTGDIVDNKLENPYVQGAWFGLDMDATDYGLEVLQDYFDDMGIDADINNTDFHKNNISYTTKDGTETTVSYEELLEYEKQKYLESRASELQAMAQKIYATGKKLKASADSAEQAVGEYLESGDIAALDVETYDAFAAMTDEERAKAIQEAVGKIDSTLLEKMGYTADEIAKKIEEQYSGLTREEVIANRLQKEELAYKNTLEQGANGLGMDKNALDAYAQSLMIANDELAKNKSQAAQVAVEHYKLGKGLNEVRKALKENIDTLKAANKNSLEYAEALGAIKTAIDKAFGSDVSFEFIEKEMGNIQDMLDGSIKAYNKVRKALVKDWIKNLELDESQIKQIDTLFDRLMKKADEGAATIKINADETAAIDSINKLVKKGLIAESELEAAFRNANLEWGSGTTFTTYSLPQGTHSKSKVTATGPDGTTTNYDIETYNETTQTLPWIGDNPPVFKNIGLAESYADAKAKFELDKDGTTNINGKDIENSDVVLVDENGKAISDDAGVKVAREKGGLVRYGYYDKGKLIKSGDSSSDFSVNTQKTYVDSSALSYDEKANESKEDRKKRQRELNDEVDRYHEIEEVLDDISKLQDKISKAKDRAFGDKKVALINAEIKALEAEGKALDKNIEKAKNYLELDKKEAAKYGLEFDAATGNLTNYEELQQKYLNKLGSMDPNTNESNYKKVEAEYEAFKAAAQKYEETYDEWEDKMEQKAENIRAQLDAKLEGISYTVELKYKISDRELAKAERTLERLQRDDDYDRAEAIIEIGKGTGAAKRKLQDAQDGIWNTLTAADVNEKDIQSYMNGNGNVLAEYDLDSNVIDQVEDFTDDTLEAYATIEENEQSMLELISDNFDYWYEKVSAIGEKLESYQSIMENYTNIIDLVGTKTLGVSNDMFKQMEKTANEAARAQVNNAKKTMETTQSALEEARKNANNKNLREAYAEEAERLEKQLLEDTENYANVWATAIELAYDTFNKETQRAIDDFEDVFSNGFSSMQQYIEQFEWSQEQDNWFVEGYEKAYELSKLTRELNNQMDKTQNIKNQKILAEFQEEIAAYQKAGVEMSQHDLDILRKRYELKLAEIALEEAQNAKSTVRLTRNSDGAYGYIYTADQNNIDQAQQNYEDKLFVVQQSNDEYLETLESQVLTNRQEMIDALRNLNIQDFANAEEYEKAKEMLIQQYTEKEKYLLEEIQKTFNSNSLVYNTDIAAYGTYIGEHNAKGAEWVRYFKDTTIAELGKGYTDLQEFHNQLNIALGDAEAGEGLLGATKIAMDGLATQVSNIFGDQGMGLTLEQFKKGVDSKLNTGEGNVSSTLDIFEEHVENVMYGKGGSANNPTGDSVVGGIKSAENATKNYTKDAKKSFPAISQEVSTWYKTYGPTLQKGKTDTENLDKALITLFKHEDRDIHAGVDIKSADIKAVRDLTDALDKLTTKINSMSSKAININVNYKTSSSSNNNQGKTTTNTGSYKTSYKIEATSADKDGYAIVKVNGKWYNSRSVNSGQGKVGDKATFINKYTYKNGSVNGPSNSIEVGKKASSGGKKINSYQILRGYMTYSNVFTEVLPGKITDEYVEDTGGNKGIYYKIGSKYYKKEDLVAAFDTGGYTGSWGPEGRIAMLHQKEIVLNAHDTENFLTAIEIVRSIANQMNLNNQKLSEYATSSTRLPKTQTETLQQEVTIHAEFPNATNHNEIEEAFGNLVNLAAQYTNRK